MKKGQLSTLNPLPIVGVFWVGLAKMGWFVWARLCASSKMDINNTCLPWAFIPHGLLLVNTLGSFRRYLQWAFGQLVVIFETIGKVSKCFYKSFTMNSIL